MDLNRKYAHKKIIPVNLPPPLTLTIAILIIRPFAEYQPELYDTFSKIMGLARECSISTLT